MASYQFLFQCFLLFSIAASLVRNPYVYKCTRSHGKGQSQSGAFTLLVNRGGHICTSCKYLFAGLWHFDNQFAKFAYFLYVPCADVAYPHTNRLLDILLTHTNRLLTSIFCFLCSISIWPSVSLLNLC